MAKTRENQQKNPFIYSGYVGPTYFCDRTEETEELIANLQNGRNTTLISPRRIGKTGLIKNVFYQLKTIEKDAICIYIDIYATKNLHDFVQLFGTAVAQHVLSYEQKALKRLLEFFGSWRPVFSTDPVTGMPTVTVSVESSQTEMSLKTIFDYLQRSDRRIYVAIDEFQQISYYPEKGTEALLRSYIQFANNVQFIFSGSKQHMMAEMFNSPQRPFYQSTASMGLYPLHEEIYCAFARHFFEAKRGGLSQETFHTIYQRFNGITWNIQQILNRLYETEKYVESEQQVNEAVRHIVLRSSMQYEGLTAFLTENQLSVLKAIAKADRVVSPQSNDFIKQYDLPSASSVKTALDVLVDKELVCHDAGGYFVYDRFFDLWLKQLV
ncbi:MAG: ATP-binding protein [Prevotella sp.]|nr:ATP-binding protein [Prevotella sp.]